MSGLEIVAAVAIGLLVLTLVYAVLRVGWRFRQGDVESAGRDSETWKRE